jgi:hypothetical protein
MFNDPHRGRGRVCETDVARVRVGQGMAGQNYCVVDGCLLSLSLCRRGFQDLFKVRPFSNLVIIYLLAYEDETECSETSAYKIQTPGNYPEENIQHTEHGESLKSRNKHAFNSSR